MNLKNLGNKQIMKKQHLKSSIEVSNINNNIKMNNHDDQVIKKTKFFKDKEVREGLTIRVVKCSRKL
jgi:hypothetical protein